MLRCSLRLLQMAVLASLAFAPQTRAAEPVTIESLDEWVPTSIRDEIRPEFAIDKTSGRDRQGALLIRTDRRPGLMGYWMKTVPVEGGRHYRFQAFRRIENVAIPRRSVNARIVWLDEQGKVAYRDLPVVGPYHPKGQPDLSTAEFPADRTTDTQGWTELSGVYRAPAKARRATIELHLEWAEAAKQKADLVVLPETLTHTGTGLSYADASEPIPGPATKYFSSLA